MNGKWEPALRQKKNAFNTRGREAFERWKQRKFRTNSIKNEDLNQLWKIHTISIQLPLNVFNIIIQVFVNVESFAVLYVDSLLCIISLHFCSDSTSILLGLLGQ